MCLSTECKNIILYKTGKELGCLYVNSCSILNKVDVLSANDRVLDRGIIG